MQKVTKKYANKLNRSQRMQITLVQLAKGRTAQEISEGLGVSKRTVEAYLLKMMKENDCRNSVQLAVKFVTDKVEI